ncbi:hypothetical protein K6025_02650 [Ehrlichia sp. JZT12]
MMSIITKTRKNSFFEKLLSNEDILNITPGLKDILQELRKLQKEIVNIVKIILNIF